jgi:hypothetical protein
MRAVLHGPLPEKWAGVADAPHLWRKTPFILLLAGLLVFGCIPRLLTDKITPSVEKITALFIAPPTATASSSAGFHLLAEPRPGFGVRQGSSALPEASASKALALEASGTGAPLNPPPLALVTRHSPLSSR